MRLEMGSLDTLCKHFDAIKIIFMQRKCRKFALSYVVLFLFCFLFRLDFIDLIS